MDRRGFPFAVIDFSGIPSASRQGAKGEPFYNLFMTKFMEYKLPTMKEPHVWLGIVEQEKLSSVTKLYKDTIKFQYNIFHITYMPAKDKNDRGHQRGQGNKQVGAVSLIFLTYNALSNGRAPIILIFFYTQDVVDYSLKSTYIYYLGMGRFLSLTKKSYFGPYLLPPLFALPMWPGRLLATLKSTNPKWLAM